jgi:hypothetical protein
MKTIYAILSITMLFFFSCNSSENKPVAQEEFHTDSMPADNTAVADSVNGNANVGMGGGK